MQETNEIVLSQEEITIRDICLRNGCRSAIKNNNFKPDSERPMDRNYYCFLTNLCVLDVTSDNGCISAVVDTRRGTMKSTGFKETAFENTTPTRIIADPHLG